MEMNTRLQVEHPITEMITKQDLVHWPLLVAAKHPLPLSQDQLTIHGHAFESRIYAENPSNEFLPGTGKLIHLSTPAANDHTRIDTGVREGDEVSVYYDPMIAKLVTWDADRSLALRRMRTALEQFQVVGLHTNVEFLLRLASHPEFIAGHVETGFIPKYRNDLLPPPSAPPKECFALASLALLLKEAERYNTFAQSNDIHSPFLLTNGRRLNHPFTRTLDLVDASGTTNKIEVLYENSTTRFSLKLPGQSEFTSVSGHFGKNGKDLRAIISDRIFNATIVENSNDLSVILEGHTFSFTIPVQSFTGAATTKGSLLSPMPGKITDILVSLKQKVTKGQPLIKMEAMKMEHTIRSPIDGIVKKINYKLNDLVQEKQLLVELSEE